MAELFDAYGTTYQDVVSDSIRFSGLKHDFFMRAKADLIHRRLLAEGRLEPGDRLRALDVGCGIGALHPYLRDFFTTLDGCDVSGESIERARQDNVGNAYAAYDGSRLPYRDHTFGFALTVCVVHHVPPPQWPAFLSEMRRVLRPGGIACIIEHNPFNPATRLAVMRCPFDEDAVLLRSATLRRLLAVAGFQDIEQEFFCLLPSARPTARRIERLLSGIPAGAQYACFARA